MGGRGLTERKTVQNINDFGGKTDTQLSSDPVSSVKDQTEQHNQEVIEDELEEGGLC